MYCTLVQNRAYTTYSLQTTRILFYTCALIVLNTSRSQGGGRTTGILPSLRPDLLSRSSSLSAAAARLSKFPSLLLLPPTRRSPLLAASLSGDNLCIVES